MRFWTSQNKVSQFLINSDFSVNFIILEIYLSREDLRINFKILFILKLNLLVSQIYCQLVLKIFWKYCLQIYGHNFYFSFVVNNNNNNSNNNGIALFWECWADEIFYYNRSKRISFWREQFFPNLVSKI